MPSIEIKHAIANTEERLSVLIEKASGSPDSSDALINEAIQQLSTGLEELRAAEEELHVQKDQLIETYSTLEYERQRYKALFDMAPYGSLITTLDGVIEQTNQAAAELFQLPSPRLIGKPLRILIAPPDRKTFLNFLNDLKSNMGFIRGSLQIKPWGQDTFQDAAIRGVALREELGQPRQLFWMIRDITIHKRLEATLRQANEALEQRVNERTLELVKIVDALKATRERFLLAQQAGEIGVWDWDLASGELIMDEWSRKIYGLSLTQAIRYKDTLDVILPDDRSEVEQFLRKNMHTKDQPDLQYRVQWPDGSVHWVYSKGNGIRDDTGKLIRVTGITMDISRLKEAEHVTLQAKVQSELEHRLIDQREKERQQIARDLHDGPVQQLIAQAYSIKALMQKLPDCVEKDELAELYKGSQELISSLRSYSGELRPPALARFGLQKALQSLVDTWQEKNPQYKIKLISDPEEDRIPEPIRLPLFRIVQESLNNILRHSKAQHVMVHLAKNIQGAVHLTIQDDGIGFTIPKDWLEIARQGHLGLVGIRERAEAIGGVVDIDSKPGQGTRVTVIVPLAEKAESVEESGLLA